MPDEKDIAVAFPRGRDARIKPDAALVNARLRGKTGTVLSTEAGVVELRIHGEPEPKSGSCYPAFHREECELLPVDWRGAETLPVDLPTALVRISNQQFQNDNLRENLRALTAELATAKGHLAQACCAAGLQEPEYHTLDELLQALNTLHDEHAFMLTGYSESEIRTMRIEIAKEKT